MPDPEIPESRTGDPVRVPVYQDVHIRIVEFKDETGRAGMLTGIDSAAPLPPPTLPKKTEGDANVTAHAEEKKASVWDKAVPWIGLAIVVLVLLNCLDNWMAGRPLLSHFFNTQPQQSATYAGGGFQGVSPAPRYHGGGGVAPARGRPQRSGQSYCDEGAPGTTFQYWIGSGLERKAHCE